MHTVVRRFLPAWQVRVGRIELFRPRAFPIERYRYRGTKIPTSWSSLCAPTWSGMAFTAFVTDVFSRRIAGSVQS